MIEGGSTMNDTGPVLAFNVCFSYKNENGIKYPGIYYLFIHELQNVLLQYLAPIDFLEP